MRDETRRIRTIEQTRRTTAQPTCELDLNSCRELDLRAWLTKERPSEANVLLAHTDEGVIWGRFADDELILGGDDGVFDDHVPRLTPMALHQVRVFGRAGELYAWRVGDHLQARCWRDSQDTNDEHKRWCKSTKD